MKGFTGIKDLDFIILDKLNDETIFFCGLINKYINTLCNEEIFWLNKYIKTFGDEAKKYKPEKRTWKEQYLKIKKNITDEDPWKFFDEIIWRIHTPPDWASYDTNNDRLLAMNRQSEKNQNRYHFLNLGKCFIIVYLTDFENGKYTKVRYNSNKAYTPEKVIKLVYEFYSDPNIFPNLNKNYLFQGFGYKNIRESCCASFQWPDLCDHEYLILMDNI
jgi:hypothetical protein